MIKADLGMNLNLVKEAVKNHGVEGGAVKVVSRVMASEKDTKNGIDKDDQIGFMG